MHYLIGYLVVSVVCGLAMWRLCVVGKHADRFIEGDTE